MTMFSAPDALWLLALVPALVWLAWREAVRRRARLAKLGDVELLSGLADGASQGRRLRLRLLGVLAFALVVVGLAGPRFGEKTELLPRKGLDVVFAIDVSSSMRARDVRPDRLERTKAELSLLFDRLREHRLGIVAFAGTAFVQCPLTDDVEAARLFLSALDPSAVPQGGTDLGAGMLTAKNLFDAEAEASPEAREAGRLLVVVTDGEDHEGGVDEAAAALKQAGVHVIVLGVGSRMGEPIPILDAAGGVLSYKKDRKGDTVMTRLSPSVLEEVATKTGGSFLEVMTRADFGSSDIEAAIGRLEKRELEARIKRTRMDRSAWPLGAAFLLLLAIAASPERARPRARRRGTPFVAPLALALVSALSVVVMGAKEARAEGGPFSRPEPHLEEGKRALERSAFDEAISRFRSAQSEHPDERAIVEYDVGRVLYEKGLAEKAASPSTGEPPAEGEAAPGTDLLRDAASAFERAYGSARDVDIRSQAALAEGNSFARAGDLERSVDAYRRSLVASPDNLRARQNLATVLRAIQQQEQQQQQQQQDEQQSGGGDEEKEQQPQTGDEQQQQEGDKKPDEQKDAQQKEQDEGKQQQDEEQEQKQEQAKPDDAAGDKKDEKQQQPPPPNEGSAEEERDPTGSAGKPKDEKKEEAKKLLDALRRRERPLNPLLMQPQRHIRSAPPEKDW